MALPPPTDHQKSPQPFYFENFPPNWNPTHFRKFFSKYLKVITVYISPRLSKSGKRFGFLRTPQEPFTIFVINNLSSLWIGKFKFKIQPAKYSSTPSLHHRVPTSTLPVKSISCPAFKHIDQRSYADVTKGILGPIPSTHKTIHHPTPIPSFKQTYTSNRHPLSKPNNFPGPATSTMTFSAIHDNLNWLQRSAVGTLTSIDILSSFKENLCKEGHKHITITPMGSNMILLTFYNTEEMCNFISRPAKWWSKWFDSISPWKPSVVNSERLVWMKAFGTPLHMWSSTFFQSLCCGFGSFVCLDRPTANKEKLDVTRFLIRTTNCNFISNTVTVTVDDEKFNLFLIEDQAMDILTFTDFDQS